MTPRVALKRLLGFLSIIEMLLKAGANVNHTSKWGTPLKEVRPLWNTVFGHFFPMFLFHEVVSVSDPQVCSPIQMSYHVGKFVQHNDVDVVQNNGEQATDDKRPAAVVLLREHGGRMEE